MKENKFLNYVKQIPKRYFITAFSGMALGLFCTLIAGTIITMFADWLSGCFLGEYLSIFGKIAKVLMGAGIGVGIAYKLNAKPLVIFSSAVAGLIGAWALNIIDGTFVAKAENMINSGLPGNPIGAYVLSMLTIEVASLYAGKTKFDIIFVPIGMIILSILGIYIAWPFIKVIDLFSELLVILINAGVAVKIIVGIIISVVMGVLLTMPTSSAAIWIAIATSNTALENPEVFAIAGGAAVAGCACHMIGFAVASFRENKWSGLISQGLGTSMLQIPNIMKKPIIMLPEIIASIISGLVAVLIDMRCTPAGGGMGTSGLVGVFGVIDATKNVSMFATVFGIIVCLFIIPAVVSFVVSELMRKKNLIEFGDQKLED
ncbi:MAG: PTS sugar transporter subunit IIC [Firmicutes bacterium]|nr:PTS sugar transporter subunit IIC [Candidatus Caballimonas caccae]